MGSNPVSILIAGSTGFLGSYLVKAFYKMGLRVIALKRSTSNTFRIKDYLDKCCFYDIDIVDLETVFSENNIDIVVNTVTNYGRLNKKISSLLETNLFFGLKLLEESTNHSVQAYINTDTMLEKKINAYALSKKQLVDWMKFFSNSSTKMINVKIEHMYGPLDDENKFIFWLIRQLRNNVNEVDLTSGVQKRDFIYVTDVVSAFCIILRNIESMNYFEEFEVGTGSSISVKQFIKQLYNELSKEKNINTRLNFGAIQYRKNEEMNMVANITKLKNLGWEPVVTIGEGIKNILG